VNEDACSTQRIIIRMTSAPKKSATPRATAARLQFIQLGNLLFEQNQFHHLEQ